MHGDQKDVTNHPAFELRLMGRAQVLVCGQERPISATKHLLLLARLARAPDRTASREQLASFLWPQSPPDRARASLRQALIRLRASLASPVDPFSVDQTRIALPPDLWRTDLDALERQDGTPGPGASFLDGVQVREPEIEEWLETERRALAVAVANRLRNAIERRIAENGPEEAIPLALRLVALDNLDESNHRLLMRLYHHAGQRSRALAQFERLKDLLRQELGEVPDIESRHLADSIRRGSPPAPAAGPAPGVKRHTANHISAEGPTCRSGGAKTVDQASRLNKIGGSRDSEELAGGPIDGRGLSIQPAITGAGRSGTAQHIYNSKAAHRRAAVVAALALVMATGAGQWFVRSMDPSVSTASETRMNYPLPQEPSIAVLPFSNLASEDVPDVVIDGLTEEIIASLTKVPQIFVINGNSTFAYKRRESSIASVAEDLGIRFVMAGSVRGSGERLRITANLVDALSGRQVWADSYDRTLDDVLALQSEIARRIVTELNVELVSGELARLQESTTSDPEAYSLFLEAQAAPRSTRENVLRRIRLYEASLARDPDFAAARAAWAVDLAQMGRTGLADRNEAYPRAEEIALTAIETDPGYSGGYLALSTIFRFRGEFERSLELVEHALEIAPNSADAIMYKGRMLRLVPGRAEEAIATIEQAMRLNPYYPPDYLSQLSWAYFAAGRYQEAHDIALEYAKLRPNHDHAHWRLAMTYAILGEPENAAQEVAATLRLNPTRTIAATLAASPYAASNPALMSAEISAMREAGFPEG